MVRLQVALLFFAAAFLGRWVAVDSNTADCPRRDEAAAKAVGRERCRKDCSAGQSCRETLRCSCAHECGMSCVNWNNGCRPVPEIPNMRGVEFTRKNHTGHYVPQAPPYRFDDRVKYLCRPGYRLTDPDVEHLCTERKRWTNLGKSICARACRRRNTQKIHEEDLVCESSCVFDSDCSAGTECLCDGHCGRTCVNPNVDCGQAPPSPNSEIIYDGVGFARVAIYSCNEGFFIRSGTPTRKCTGGGRWDGRAIECQPVQCLHPESAIDAQNGFVEEYREPPYFVGDHLAFGCNFNYKLTGARNRTCMSNGRWSGIDPVCDPIRRRDEPPRCSHPGVPIGGSTIPQTLRPRHLVEGATVRFTCGPNLILLGEEEQECLYFLEWSGGGAPQCVDPRYRDSDSSVIEKLTESTDLIKSQLPQVGRFISVSENTKHEVYFLFDLSDSVSESELNNSLTFAVKLIERLAVNARNLIEYGVMVFASQPMVLISTLDDDDLSPDQIIDAIVNIGLDRATIQDEIRRGTHTQQALRELANQLEVSYFQSGNDTSKERHVFIITDGEHNEGGPPEREVYALSARDNPPTFYSITSCVECTNLGEGSDAYKELLGLARDRLENFIIIDNFYRISELLDRVTNARIDYSECGQAGDVGSVRQQARIGRVISGTRASTRSWPWQVGISLFDEIVAQSYTMGAFQGGGSLINNRWVLTAAHLFEFVDRNPGWEEKFLLSFGIHILPQDRQDALSAKVKVYTADKIIEHPDFARASLYDFDVALMRIGKEYEQQRTRFNPTGVEGWLNYTEYIRPVCLPCMENSCVGEYLRGEGLLQGDETEERKCEIETDFLLSRGAEDRVLAVSTGFGHVEERMFREARDPVPSPSLQQGLHRVREDYHCGNFTEVHLEWGIPGGIPYTDQMLCATSGIRGQNIDSCQGDSGGPMVREVSYVTDEERKSCWVQIGIVSFGWGCGQFQRVNGRDLQVPGYYTNVMSVSSWIKAELDKPENNAR